MDRNGSNGLIENRTFDEIAIGESASLSRTLSKDDIALFAVMSGDVNPAHLDEPYAKASLFHRIIGHGMWGGALISAVLGTKLPGPGTIYLGQDLRFRRPVFPGDTITVTVTAKEKRPEKRVVVFDCRIEAYVIHASSIAVSQEHKRPKSDRLDVELLKRGFLGWLRGETDHCKMVAIPTCEEEDAKRPGREREKLVSECTRIVNGMKADLTRLGVRNFNPKLKKASEKLDGVRTPEGGPIPPNTIAKLRRDMERLRLFKDQIKRIEAERLELIKKTPEEKAHAMILLLSQVMGLGIETAEMLVREALSRTLRDRRAVVRLAGLTGSPDESGSRRREKGLARAGSARLRTGMIQLAWRMLMFQKNSALVQWFLARTADGRPTTRKTMIVALARKLLIALWRMSTTGEIPQGFVLRPTA